MWRGGCIIRSQFLNDIKQAYDTNPELDNLLLADYFKDAITGADQGWREAIILGVQLGVPTPAFSSALAYYDSYRFSKLHVGRGFSPPINSKHYNSGLKPRPTSVSRATRYT
jgi:6-phosphogluconate dehydrogenase